MKKLTIADVKPFEILSKEERKMVLGGEDLGSATGKECYEGTECSIKDPDNGLKTIKGTCTSSCVCKKTDGTTLQGGGCVQKVNV